MEQLEENVLLYTFSQVCRNYMRDSISKTSQLTGNNLYPIEKNTTQVSVDILFLHITHIS